MIRLSQWFIDLLHIFCKTNCACYPVSGDFFRKKALKKRQPDKIMIADLIQLPQPDQESGLMADQTLGISLLGAILALFPGLPGAVVPCCGVVHDHTCMQSTYTAQNHVIQLTRGPMNILGNKIGFSSKCSRLPCLPCLSPGPAASLSHCGRYLGHPHEAGTPCELYTTSCILS